MSTQSPWDMSDDHEGALNFFVMLLLTIGLIMLLRSCYSDDANFKQNQKTTIQQRSPTKTKSYIYKAPPKFSGKRYAGKNWGRDKTWRSMGPYQMVAAMAILETRKNKDGTFCFICSENIVHTIINRASLDGDKLAAHVSKPIYQPVIEPHQYKVLSRYVGTQEHKKLSEIAFKRHTGQIKDKVNGATHYLVHPRVMVSLQKKQPCKYWSWGPFKCKGKTGANWTGYDPSTKRYRNQVLVDSDHAFLVPQGKHSAKGVERE